MMRKWTKRRVGAVVVALGLATSLAACGSDDGDGEAADNKEITLGIIPSWTDGLSTAYLWKDLLEDEGYDVKIQDIADAGVLYTGLAKGDIDIYPSAWPEVTHQSYMDQYSDEIEDLGTYYDNAKLTLAVPTYSDLESIADLKGQADRFDGKIIGIEPGAGLTKVTKESVMPTYGLDEDYKLVESSTSAMIAELGKATKAKDDIVVTLWRPFWANNAYPVKDLADPEGALGEAEGLHALAREGFSDDFPEVAEMIGKAKMDDEQYGSLEDHVVNKFEKGKESDAVAAWLEANPDWAESLG